MAQVREKRLHVYPGGSGTFSGGVSAGWTVLCGVVNTGAGPAGATLDLVAGTQVDQVTAGSTTVTLYKWTNISAGPGAIVVASAGDQGFTAYAISGAETASDPVEDFGSGGGVGTSLTTNLALSGGGGFYCWYGNETTNAFTSFTASLVTNGTDTGHIDADGSLEVASGNANVGVNVTSDSNNAFVAVALKDAGGGAVSTKTLTDTLAVADFPVGSAFRNRLASDSIVSVDEGATFRISMLDAYDTLEVSDSSPLWMIRNRIIADLLTTYDEAITTLVANVIYAKVLSSTIAPSDGLSAWVSRARSADSGISIDDVLQSARALAVQLTDIIDPSDEALPFIARYLVLDDSFDVSDQVQRTYLPSFVYNPRIMVGVDQPRIEIGGYAQ